MRLVKLNMIPGSMWPEKELPTIEIFLNPQNIFYIEVDRDTVKILNSNGRGIYVAGGLAEVLGILGFEF